MLFCRTICFLALCGPSSSWILQAPSCTSSSSSITAGISPIIDSRRRISPRLLFTALDASSSAEQGKETPESPDLFDYFDPLLSPHAYPEGVSPEKQPQATSANQQYVPPKTMSTFGIDYTSNSKNPADEQQESLEEKSQGEKDASPSSSAGGRGQPDLFEYFDPLVSPHAYPNGVTPNENNAPKALEVVQATVPPSLSNTQDDKEEEERYNPLAFKFAKNQRKNTDAESSSSNRDDSISSGTSNSNNKIGVLLMDHGSRNEASNQRLEHLAKLYQLTMPDENIVVEFAHMEISPPSIPDGLQALLKEGVDEIVCHPYFLSPGRHVREDIPQIVQEAIETLDITIPVITTDPVGSNTQLMIGAIHSLVRENSQLLSQRKEQ